MDHRQIFVKRQSECARSETEDTPELVRPERLVCRDIKLPAAEVRDMLSLAELHGRTTAAGIKLAISQEELAQFLGVSRQIVNQHLQTWKSEGWIQLGRGNVTVANVRSLETLIRES